MAFGAQSPQPTTRIAVVGHSHAAEGGATIPDYGAWHKLASHLNPARLRSTATGGSILSLGPEGTVMGGQNRYGSYARVLYEFDRRRTRQWGPYLPPEQVVGIWYGVHDLAYLGPNNLAPFQHALRAIIARFRSSVVYEDVDTSAILDQSYTAFTPITYVGTWGTFGAWGYSSNGTLHSTTTPYGSAQYIRVTLPSDFEGGMVVCGFLTGSTGGDGCRWELVDVTTLKTTLTGAHSLGATTITVASTAGLVAGGTVTIGSSQASASNRTVLAVLSSTQFTITTGLAAGLGSGDLVYAPGFVTQHDNRNTNGFEFNRTRANSGHNQATCVRANFPAPPSTTLSVAMDPATTTTITVASTAGFPASGTLRIDSELITYTGITATTFTGITRSVAGSQAGATADHEVGTAVSTYRVFELHPMSITGTAWFDYVGLESSQSPVIACMLPPRMMIYNNIYRPWPYDPNYVYLTAQANAGTASVQVTSTTLTADPGTGGTTLAVNSTAGFPMVGSLRIDNEVVTYTGTTPTAFGGVVRAEKGTTAAAHAIGAVVAPRAEPGATVTVGSGGTAETRSVSSQTGATIALSGGNFANTHAIGESVQIGIQDYDLTVTLSNAITSVVNEFADSNVFTVDVDSVIGKSWANYAGDGLHFNDRGHGIIAQKLLEVLRPRLSALSLVTRPVVDDRRSYTSSVYNGITFSNNWGSYTVSDPTVADPPVQLWKDVLNGTVHMQGVVRQNPAGDPFNTTILTLPKGMRPFYDLAYTCATDKGPGVLQIGKDGTVRLLALMSGTSPSAVHLNVPAWLAEL